MMTDTNTNRSQTGFSTLSIPYGALAAASASAANLSTVLTFCCSPDNPARVHDTKASVPCLPGLFGATDGLQEWEESRHELWYFTHTRQCRDAW